MGFPIACRIAEFPYKLAAVGGLGFRVYLLASRFLSLPRRVEGHRSGAKSLGGRRPLRLCKYFEDMNPVSTQAFMGTQAAPSVLHSDNLQQHEQLLLSLLTHIKDQYSTLITTEQTKQIDAIVDSFVSEGHKTEKEQFGGTRNHILTNLTQEPAISPGDYNEGSRPASTQEIVTVGGTTNTRKRKRVEEYVPLVHTTKKPTGSELSLNNSPFKSNETGKTPQSASMVRPLSLCDRFIYFFFFSFLICSSRKPFVRRSQKMFSVLIVILFIAHRTRNHCIYLLQSRVNVLTVISFIAHQTIASTCCNLNGHLNVVISSQNDKRTIHLKPRDARHALYRNVAAAI
ncbi:hypothetical protein C4D60_Mb06t08980 [Musa balbisiana]|uniref:CPL3 ARM repeat domain-containing protein n=1 Tax=Musa balbisiana TaxID=52838 RepID=A0A4S8IP54_MUSBA|nr:hypothetical protein C4D60_Mb06t08980 [Musa balbisiana]